jgi:hypothetical protein
LAPFSGFKRIEAPKFEFKTIWIQHDSGLTMHLIEGKPDFRLAEGPMRNAETGALTPTPFKHGALDPIHLRRGEGLSDCRVPEQLAVSLL